MKALSIKQPWAWLICTGYKDIENRNFDAPRCGRIYIHAGRNVDNEGIIWLGENKERLGIQGCMPQWTEICNTWKQGAIIGEVDIEYVTSHSKSPWFFGPLGYVLKNPILYDKPISYKGRLGFFEVPKPENWKRSKECKPEYRTKAREPVALIPNESKR